MALTALAIKNLKPKTALYRVADSGGLCLEISPNRAEYLLERKKMMQDYADYLDAALASPDNVVQGDFAKGKDHQK